MHAKKMLISRITKLQLHFGLLTEEVALVILPPLSERTLLPVAIDTKLFDFEFKSVSNFLLLLTGAITVVTVQY